MRRVFSKHLILPSIKLIAVFVGILLSAGSSRAQTSYFWNNTGTDFATAANWLPNGVPTLIDTVTFGASDGNGNLIANAPINPILNGNQAVLSLTAATNTANSGYTFTSNGSNTLTIGGTGSTGVTTYGPQTFTFNGPILAGASSTSTLIFNAFTSSTLVVAGNTTALTNIGNINIKGGTFTLDDTATNISRLPTTNTIVLNGGTFSVLGNLAGSTFNVGILNVTAGATTPGEGAVTISVTDPFGATAGSTLNFANTGSFTLRTTTGLGYTFVGLGGVLGSAAGPKITFTGAPTITTTTGTGMIVGSTTQTSSTVGFAVATDSSGTGWATYVTPSGNTGGIEILQPSTTATTAAQLQALTIASVADFTPAASSTTTLTANSTTGSLRIVPADANSTLALSTFILQTNALMLTGSNNFTITGGAGSTLNGTATKLIWVINPGTSLFIQVPLDGAGSNGNPVDICGPGFVVLTGTASQFTVTTTNRLNLINGTLRGNATELGGLGATGGTGVISFRGGVLEITGGSNGTGSAADFTRPINYTNTAGAMNWCSSTSGDSLGGSGGFSAYGAAASVNIGGNSTPTTLTWGVASSGFVQDGYALLFGSTQSNAVLTFLNPLVLTSGTAYVLREIRVTGGTGGDMTVLAGAVSGPANADLIKTGTGILQFGAANTNAGATLISAGTLQAGVTNAFSSSSSVLVSSGATLSLNGFNNTIAALSGSGSVQNGGSSSSALTIGGNTSTTFSGVMQDGSTGSLNVIKNGTGAFILTGTNTYSGTTTVNNGTLGGTGSIASALTVNNGGTLQPGLTNTPGTFTVNNSVTLANGAVFSVRLNSASSYDQLNIGSAGNSVNLTGLPTLSVMLNYAPATSDVFTIISNASGTTSGNFNNGSSFTAAFGGTNYNATISYAGNNVTLSNFTPAPEPASLLLMGGAACGLAGWVRRRR